MPNAIVIEGAVIVSDDGSQVKYHTRCPNCGYVLVSSLYSGQVASHTIKSMGGHTCAKCKKSFIVKMKR